jgi:hypothetical protein
MVDGQKVFLSAYTTSQRYPQAPEATPPESLRVSIRDPYLEMSCCAAHMQCIAATATRKRASVALSMQPYEGPNGSLPSSFWEKPSP